VRCANCGGELPGPTRFCPHCSAPQPGFDEATAPQASARPPSWVSAHHLSAILVFLATAIVVFAILAVLLGWVGADLIGL
jgi:predicted amidophosphoribosyltransferase